MSVDYVRRSDDISIVNTFTAEYTGEQTDVALITPTSGKAIEIYSILLHSEASAGTIALDFATSTKKVARLYAAKNGQIYTSRMKVTGATNEVLTLNISGVNASDKTFVLVNYREV